ncbi:hypothetical protein ACILG0_04675 [Pseudomonadota bacterium AL_CKDN230030165-1A_HGKHYDSX7]
MGRFFYTVYAVIVIIISNGVGSSGGGSTWGTSSIHSGWSSSGSHK